MLRWRWSIFVVLALYAGLSSTYLVTYSSRRICGGTIQLGRRQFGVKVDFQQYGEMKSKQACTINVQVTPPYKIALQRTPSICDDFELLVDGYRFSRCYLPDIQLPQSSNITILSAGHHSATSKYSFVFYAFREYTNLCDSSSSRCMNGRCIHRDLFCNDEFNFCADQTDRNCHHDITGEDAYDDAYDDAPSTDFGESAGLIALIIAMCLLFILIVYFCCCRLGRDTNTSDNNARTRTQTPTASDVYTIPTSRENPDGIDYVIDYQKFEEPPAYDTLELTAMSDSNTAHAIESSECTQSERTAALPVHSNAIHPATCADTNVNRESINTPNGEGTLRDGVINEAFEDELPSYSDVLSDGRRFNT